MTHVDSSSRLDSPDAPGALAGGRYRLVEPIGKGGMGVVWAATDVKLGAPVALKLALPPVEAFAAARARFAREARIGAVLGRQRGFVRALDWGELEPRRSLYLVMDLVPRARPLDLRGGPLPERLERIAEAAALVARVHARGIVHRDIRPATLLVCGANEVHLTDFGLARELRSATPSASGAPALDDGANGSSDGSVGGTPSFLAPELFEDAAAAGPPGDVFALGVVLFLALTGRLPYPGETAAQVLTAQLEVRHGRRPRPSLAGAPGDVDPAVLRACEAALALEPSRRPTAARLARTLQSLDRAGGRRDAVPASVRRPSQEPTPVASPRPTPGGVRRSSAVSLTAAVRVDALGMTSPEGVDRAVSELGAARFRQLLGPTGVLHVKAEHPLPDVDASAYVGRLALLARHGGAPGPVLLGRSRDADIVLPLSTISKMHLRFDRRGDEWFVREEGSRNGTRHGRLRLRDGNPTLLRGGDELCLSEHLVLEYVPAERLLEWVAARQAPAAPRRVDAPLPSKGSEEETAGFLSEMPVTPEPGVLEGSFGPDELIELLQMLEFYRKEGVLRLAAGGSPRGELFLQGGRVRGARTPDGLLGAPALEALLRLSRGRMRFHPRLPARFEGDLDQPISGLLLELVRQRDEAARAGRGDG